MLGGQKCMKWMLLGLLVLAWSTELSRGDEVSEALELGDGVKKEERCPVKDQGAVGDGNSKDTLAIQAAVDACAAKEDGGIVEFEAGKKYLSGSLKVASKVTLLLPERSELIASSKREDYPAAHKDWYLILIDKATRVSIEGGGQISGTASEWQEEIGSRKVLRNWADESCMNIICRPHLIGVRDSTQVTIQNLEIRDFVRTGLHIQRSSAVAILAMRLWSDPSFHGTDGIVVDSSKRVFIGQTYITSGGNAIAAGATSGNKALESLLVDNVVLKSSAAAIQIGPVAKAEIKTIVVQNAEIQPSHRGLSLQLQDSMDMHDMWFTNVTITSQHAESTWLGAAEGIHASVKPSAAGASVGKMSNIWFGNVTSRAEGGFVFSGSPESTIDGITIKDTSLELAKMTSQAASFRDYRPSHAGVVNASSVPAIFLEYANHVSLSNVEVVFGSPGRSEWGGLLEMKPHTVHSLQLEDVHMHDEAAHPSSPFVAPMKKVSQLGEFFRHSVREWVTSLSNKGFISVQENAAFGVSGRKAASSGSPAVMGLLLVVLVGILVRYCCLPALRGSSRGRRLPT